jgi:hypothetical protein
MILACSCRDLLPRKCLAVRIMFCLKSFDLCPSYLECCKDNMHYQSLGLSVYTLLTLCHVLNWLPYHSNSLLFSDTAISLISVCRVSWTLYSIFLMLIAIVSWRFVHNIPFRNILKLSMGCFEKSSPCSFHKNWPKCSSLAAQGVQSATVLVVIKGQLPHTLNLKP